MVSVQVVVVEPRLVLPLYVVQVMVHVPLFAEGNWAARLVGGVQLYDVATPVAIVPEVLP